MIAGDDALGGYYVCRQLYYYTGELMVEITEGGLDYAGPDMLVNRYPDEAEAYQHPRQAAQAAIKIQKLWQADEPADTVHICVRSQVGGYFGLEGEPITPADLLAWTHAAWAALPKCQRCGDVMPENGYGNEFTIFDNEYPFCSENCADNAQQEWLAELEGEQLVEDGDQYALDEAQDIAVHGEG